jgi:hypothetical protein
VNDGGDVFATLRWGLRRYAWVVALFVLGLAVLVPTLMNRVPDQYEAQAQVGPTGSIDLPNLDPLPRLGTTVFNNGAVADAVRGSVDPPLARSVGVIPDRVDLVAAQDNIVFVVVGRGSTPEAAEQVANVAAAAFTQELNRYAASVGSFAIQHLAEEPTEPVASLAGPMTVAIGVVAGLVGGVGVVALLLVMRRPVLDAGTAEELARAPVYGRIRLAGSHGNLAGLPRVARRVQANAADTLLLAGPRSTRRARRVLPRALAGVLGRAVTMVTQDGSSYPGDRAPDSPADDSPRRRPLAILVDPSQAQLATRPDTALTLLVVREGVSHASLRRQAEQFLDDGNCGVVLVHGQRVSRAWRTGRGRDNHSPKTQSSEKVASDDGPVMWYARD